eukprot:TRINITY_DN94948_c0_g1_i1.p1 TRINITY_DN94948_c0_g1~~TRINITY_DN94948_c0_g1_i1.p1  ORF type:complete len:209 (+),score=25.14 TRINITY_DN94948_c0_g1_i1:45-671(+)
MACGLFSLGTSMPKLHPLAWVAPGAQVVGDVELGSGVSVWFNCVLRGDDASIIVGDGTNIQDLTMIHLDTGLPCRIGRNCSVGHGCILHGCTIQDDVLIGMGATVMNRAVIGQGSVVGAGAVVLEGMEVPPLSLVVGSPAKVKKTYSESERRDAQQAHATSYAAKAQRFRLELRHLRGPSSATSALLLAGLAFLTLAAVARARAWHRK